MKAETEVSGGCSRIKLGGLWGDKVALGDPGRTEWDPYRGRTQVPALPGVGREVVQHKVTKGTVEVMACGR